MKMDLRKVLVLILAGGKGQRLEPLTRDRPKPAVPFGGIYRIIDFTLSNCLNSNLKKALIFVQCKSISLNRHIRDGWNMYFTPSLGEYIETIPPQHRTGEQWYVGTADSVYQNLYSVEKEDPENVLILAGDHIYKMDYRRMLEFHISNNADMTVGAVEVKKEESSNFGILQVDPKNQIIGFEEKPSQPTTLPNNPDICLGSMGIYVFKTSVMYKILEEDAGDPNSSHDFGKDIIPKIVGRHKVMAFSFVDENKKEAKYWRDVGTIDAYYQANMDLIDVTPQLNLYDQSWTIRTASVQAPPPKFVFADEERKGIALDSIISPGVIVSGGRVQNSVLSPFVRIHSYSSIIESILFENVNVNRNAKIRRAIIDKDVVIPEGMEIGYNIEEDKKRFTVSEGGIVVISKGERL
ncbi:glucose-1-phosphate adenylyltransferase [Candidatus Peregrinibacteria bacterium]|nr:glucose-1-phosphate adenylyltransferase [Candidatus Peregrinibacteria bacterium]